MCKTHKTQISKLKRPLCCVIEVVTIIRLWNLWREGIKRFRCLSKFSRPRQNVYRHSSKLDFWGQKNTDLGGEIEIFGAPKLTHLEISELLDFEHQNMAFVLVNFDFFASFLLSCENFRPSGVRPSGVRRPSVRPSWRQVDWSRDLPIKMPYFDAQNQAILKFRGGPILESQKFQFHHLNLYFFDPQNRV